MMDSMASVAAIIPARAGSKGVVDKNIKPLASQPLIAYSIVAAKLARNIDRVIVSTAFRLTGRTTSRRRP